MFKRGAPIGPKKAPVTLRHALEVACLGMETTSDSAHKRERCRALLVSFSSGAGQSWEERLGADDTTGLVTWAKTIVDSTITTPSVVSSHATTPLRPPAAVATGYAVSHISALLPSALDVSTAGSPVPMDAVGQM